VLYQLLSLLGTQCPDYANPGYKSAIAWPQDGCYTVCIIVFIIAKANFSGDGDGNILHQV